MSKQKKYLKTEREWSRTGYRY